MRIDIAGRVGVHDAYGGVSIELAGRQERLVLVVLVLHLDRPVARDVLADAMWSGDPPASWEPALRGVVSRVRGALSKIGIDGADALTSAFGCYRLRLPAGASVDVHEATLRLEGAEAALAAGRPSQALVGAQAAREILARPLLEGEDADWVDAVRQTLRDRLLRALDVVASAAADAGHPAAAVAAAQEAVVLEPFRESAHRRLMAAHAANGNPDQALLAYERCRALLLEELGVDPSIETRQMHAELLRGDDESVSDTGFAGRPAELERLAGAWIDARDGRSRIVLIAGEPGSGKTRLAAEFGERVRSDGGRVLWGRSFEGEWSPPWWPLHEALRDAGLDAPSSTGPLPPEEQRYRITETTVRSITALTLESPVLLVLDDLQWADSATLATLQHLARAARTVRLLVIAATRVPEPAALRDAVANWRRETTVERIALYGLDENGVREIARGRFGDDVVSAVTRKTRGNPLFVQEVFAALESAGHSSLDSVGVPEGVREVIRRRVGSMSPTAVKIVSAACAINGPFEWDIAVRVAAVDDASALDALDELLAASVIEPSAGDSYRFRHDLMRQSLYDELNPSRRSRLHRRIAEELAGEHAGEVAYHYVRSAALPGADAGVEHASAAAAGAETSGAYVEAVSFLRTAIALAQPGDARLPGLEARLSIALAWSMQYDESVRVAQATAERQPDPPAFLSEVADILGTGSNEHAWALAAAGVRLAHDRRDEPWARLILWDLQRREVERPDHPGVPFDVPERWEAVAILRQRPHDPRESRWAVARTRAEVVEHFGDNPILLAYYAGEFEAAGALLTTHIERARRAGRAPWHAQCLAHLARCRTAQGRLDEARSHLAKAEAVAPDTTTGVVAINIFAAHDEIGVATDDAFEAIHRIAVTLARGSAPGTVWVIGPIRASLARMEARVGRNDRALELVEGILPLAEAAPAWANSYTRMVCDAAEAVWTAGCADHARRFASAIERKVIAADFRGPMMDGRLALARLCSLEGRHDEAAWWFRESRSVLRDQGALPLLAIADYDEALAATRRGDDLPTALVDRAAAAFDALGMTGWSRRAAALKSRSS